MIGRRLGASGGKTACRGAGIRNTVGSQCRQAQHVGKRVGTCKWNVHTYTDGGTEVFWVPNLPRIESHGSPSSCAQCSSQHPNLPNPPACLQFAVLGSSVGVSEVMQVAPSSSTCRNDRDALLCRRSYCTALKRTCSGNRLRHRRVGTRLHIAPLNLSDPIYICRICTH